MLRALVALLLLANLLFFLWARGALAPALPPPHQGEREPERLAAQLHPEAVRVLTPQAASAAVAAAQVACLEAGPFPEAEAASASAALAAASVPAGAWSDQPTQPAPDWIVYMGRYASEATMRAKIAELERRGISFQTLNAPPELAPGLALSHHASQAEAEAALVAAAASGVRTARVASVAAPSQHWLRAEHADPALQHQLTALKPPQIALAFKPCAKR